MSDRNVNVEAVSIALQMGWNGNRPMPTLLVGVPGTGKTKLAEQAKAKLEGMLRRQGRLEEGEEFHMETYVGPQTSPDAIEGMGVPDAELGEAKVLDYLPRRGIYKLNEAKFSLLFLDELSSASDETGAAFMATAQDGRAGDTRLKNTVGILCAMNPADCAAAGRDLSIPETNRFFWIPDWRIPRKDYLDYLRGGEGFMAHFRELPIDWEEEYGQVARNLLANFLEQNPHLINTLLQSDEDAVSNVNPEKAAEDGDPTQGPWRSERSWFNACRFLAANMALGEPLDSKLVKICLEGCVGKVGGNLFWRYVQENNVPSPKLLLDMLDKKGQDGVTEFMMKLRSDERKEGLENLAHFCAGTEERIEQYGLHAVQNRFNNALKIVSGIFNKRRDDTSSAMEILKNNIPPGVETPQELVHYLNVKREIEKG